MATISETAAMLTRKPTISVPTAPMPITESFHEEILLGRKRNGKSGVRPRR